jgi:hypothetical protein
MSAKHHPKGKRRHLLPVLVYYVVLAAIVALLLHFFPGARGALTGGEVVQATGGRTLPDSISAVGSPMASLPAAAGVLSAIAILGSLAIMVPVAWIYMITRQYRGYDEAVVQTLLILSVAVTGIVVVVHDSLALGFALAGIVAGVRFRVTLEDTKDAVYVFLAIGVGLASGVQALDVGMVLSLFFNAVVLVMWKARIGNVYAMAGPGEIGLGDTPLGPGTTEAMYVLGDASLIDAAAPQDLSRVVDRAARMEQYLAEERTKGKSKRANALLLVHTTAAGRAQAFVDPILTEVATRYKLAEIAQGAPGHMVLEYLVRLDGEGMEGTVLDRLRQDEKAVDAVELRSLKGLKKRT